MDRTHCNSHRACCSLLYLSLFLLNALLIAPVFAVVPGPEPVVNGTSPSLTPAQPFVTYVPPQVSATTVQTPYVVSTAAPPFAPGSGGMAPPPPLFLIGGITLIIIAVVGVLYWYVFYPMHRKD
jgi:hypothetical protein